MSDQGNKEIYRSKLAQIQGSDGAFVIFSNSDTSVFIQFATMNGSPGFYADIPSSEMNPTQPSPAQIEKHFPDFERSESPHGSDYNHICRLDEAVELTERFFSELCDYDESFELGIDLHPG